MKLETSLSEFVRHFWHVVEPTTFLQWNWHLDVLCEYLEAVTAGHIQKLLINIPPGTAKSLVVGVFWPAWEWATDPSLRYLCGSFAEELTVRDSSKARDVVESAEYQALWPGVQFRSDANQKLRRETTAGGWRIATSVGGRGTGEHPDRIIVDDPHNPKGAESDATRQAGNRWFDGTLSTRGASRRARFVVIMQRLHENDLSGHILKRADAASWVHLFVPMRFEEPGPSLETLATRPKVDPRKDGELLWPALFPEPVVQTLEASLGSYGSAGQLQQRPSPTGGGIWHRGWWKHYDTAPERFDEQIISWDMAFKDLSTSDFVVGQVWGRVGAIYYLLDQVRGKLDFSGTVQAVLDLAARWPKATAKLIEDKANGPAVIAVLRKRIPGLLPVNPQGGKVARAQAVSPAIESGNVYLPALVLRPWVDGFIEECAMFPNGANDDQVDAASQALLRFLRGTGARFQPKSFQG